MHEWFFCWLFCDHIKLTQTLTAVTFIPFHGYEFWVWKWDYNSNDIWPGWLGVLRSTPYQHLTIHRHLSHILCTQAVNQFWTSYSLGRIMIATPIKIISWLGYWRCNKILAIEFFKSSVWIHVRGRHVDDHFNKYILDSVLGSLSVHMINRIQVILHLLPSACSPPCFPLWCSVQQSHCW